MPAATAAALGLRYEDESSEDDAALRCRLVPSKRIRVKDRGGPLEIDFDDRQSFGPNPTRATIERIIEA